MQSICDTGKVNNVHKYMCKLAGFKNHSSLYSLNLESHASGECGSVYR
jgi:hypothetical protein